MTSEHRCVNQYFLHPSSTLMLHLRCRAMFFGDVILGVSADLVLNVWPDLKTLF